MKRCPTTEQLERWLRQPAEDPEGLAAHVDGCPRCQQALEILTANPSPALTESLSGPLATTDGRALGGLKEAPPAPGPAARLRPAASPGARGPERTVFDAVPSPRDSTGARSR